MNPTAGGLLHRKERFLGPQRAPSRILRVLAKPRCSASKASGAIHPFPIDRRSVLEAAALTFLGCVVYPAQPSHAAIIDENTAQKVFDKASRSVVSIIDYSFKGGAEVQDGLGTGFVWDSYGHIVTNYHVIGRLVLEKSGSKGVKVTLLDSSGEPKTFPATIIGKDASHDLAVLSIGAGDDAGELLPLPLGSSAELKVGQTVYALGNPYGLDKSLTAGVVSGLNRTMAAPTGTRIYGAIQTDASINAGNSGGPLLDSFGRLVGVNTATFTRAGTGRGSGVNFALPVDLVRDIVPNLVVYGTATGRGVRSG